MNKYSTTNWRRNKYKSKPHSYGEVHRRRQSFNERLFARQRDRAHKAHLAKLKWKMGLSIVVPILTLVLMIKIISSWC